MKSYITFNQRRIRKMGGVEKISKTRFYNIFLCLAFMLLGLMRPIRQLS